MSKKELIIEEIKSTKVDLSNMKIDTRPEHLMQAKMYAYMYLMKHDLRSINVRLTYIYVDDYKTKSFNKRYNKEKMCLESYFQTTKKDYNCRPLSRSAK